ncbi:cation transporter [Nocardia otitidiscaviarum]|uniref:Cadmium, cobalt and zinc/H(+)-K(+) antiporter n=1 Tax=Nocardia otitidiscaviarum TaxID=1823 RepID=A0A378YHQ7_9NOCA|nr:cation diffusion facilitator family transporter [Nocardia otitidiscaviarum]MBF6133965.1 cation transporter [Nocardia otitidiscaviarum]MBF6235944.1 cation transporter [Nocardia otitidiscaviarum]MBF6484374.1 cation transporter [Nocardia otitidiscaviarum]MCP9621187.1 cation diffusion facilitator family transporter [Nocardia otitidiscaviarum]SUA76273.1 Cadmium, cobalt and zinc/H(+)-K(+) antiporter [Nocardia otitidiscaviarum]
MGHDHSHGIAPESASGKYLSRLVMALGIAVVFMLAEFVVAFWTSSLALLSDAAHMLTDVVGVGMALSAILLAKRSRPTYTRTFGYYRAEVLAALANAVLLFGVAIYVLYEAIARLGEPPEVPGWPVLIVGALGMVANIASALLLRSGAKESLNVRGAYLEVFADLIGSVGVLISAAITLTTGWRYADMIIGVAIGLWVLPRTWVLARRSLRILFQHSPENLDVEQIAAALHTVPGVADVHDLHVWTLTSGMEVASAHITVAGGHTGDDVLRAAQHVLAHDFHIEHATLQVEGADSARRCAELSW